MNCIIADPEFSKCNGCNQLLPINDFYIMKQKYISKRGNQPDFINILENHVRGVSIGNLKNGLKTIKPEIITL